MRVVQIEQRLGMMPNAARVKCLLNFLFRGFETRVDVNAAEEGS